MTTEKEITSTEKLLEVIRGSDYGASRPPENTEPPGLMRRIRSGWFPSGSRGVTGVEIFRDTLNIVRINRDKSGSQPVYAARIDLPENIEIHHTDFPAFLKKQLSVADPFRKTDIWACLPPSRGETWNVLVPRVKKKLTNAVYWSARKERAFDENEYCFDYRITEEVIDKGIPKLMARVCIASLRDINLYRKIFSEAGYPIKGITLPSFSLENLFARRWVDPGNDAYAALYIGEDSSYIEIHGRRTTLFNRVIRTGRDSILDSFIAEYREQTHEGGGSGSSSSPEDRQKAARILKQQAELSGESLLDLIHPALERLARQLERTIDHSVNVLENPAPQQIYICGAISFLPGLSEFFSEQLGIMAVIMDVPEEQSAQVFPKGNERPCLVSTAGLAMPADNTVNFLYTAVDKDRERKAIRNTNFVAALCALLFVATAAWWWTARYELQQVHSETAELEEQLAGFNPRLTTDDLARLAGELREKKDELRRYSRKLYPVAVFRELSRITPGGIELLALRLESEQTAASARNRRKEPLLMIEGFIRSGPSLLQLRRSSIFKNTSVAGTRVDTLDTGETVYRFTLNMELTQI